MAQDRIHQLFNNSQFAQTYKMVERFTGKYAREILERAHFKDDLSKMQKLVVLDNACGTGVVSATLMAMTDDSTAPKVDLTCADFADAMLDIIKKRIETEPWPNAKPFKADAQDTKLPSSHFTHIFFSFGPMLIPNPYSSIKECYRMLAPKGLLGINTWEHVGWYGDFQEAFAKKTNLPALPSHNVFVQGFSKTKERWDRAEFVREHLEKNGFVEVSAEPVPGQTTISVEEAAGMMPQVLNIVYNMFWTEEQRNDAGLKEEAVKAVTTYLREKYGSGEIVWDWVAICGLGRKPE